MKSLLNDYFTHSKLHQEDVTVGEVAKSFHVTFPYFTCPEVQAWVPITVVI